MSKRIPPRLSPDDQLPVTPARWQLGDFELDEIRRELRRGECVIPVEPKPLHLLMLLARHPGELITKDELVDRLWGGRPISDTVIARCVTKLRAALSPHQDWVRTIHGYGYRFDGWVEPLSGAAPQAAPTTANTATLLPGREGWQLLERLGQSGETWLARDDHGTHRVFKLAFDAARLTALKREATVHRLLAANPDTASDLVPLLDWNFHAEPYFLEFEYCAAGSLSQWLTRRGAPLSHEWALQIVTALARKLSAIHALGVLHKDFKPDNVLIMAEPPGSPPRLALADFGSGGVIGVEQLKAMGITRIGLSTSVFEASDGSGTPLYLAPEVIAGRPWTRQADIYALGVLLYQLLVNDLRRPLAPGWEREIDDPLLREDIAATCDQDPRHRLADAGDLAQRLSTLEARRAARAAAAQVQAEAEALRLNYHRVKMRRRWQGAVIAALSIGLALSGMLFFKARRAQQAAEHAGALAQATSHFLNDSLLGAADPYRVGGGRNVTIASVLDTAVRDFGRLEHQPALQVELGTTLASAYHNLGLEPQAREVALMAMNAATRAGIAPDNAALNTLRDRIAWIEVDLARYDDANLHFTEMLAHGDSETTRNKARYGLARVRFELGYYEESASGYRALLPTSKSRGDHEADADFLSDVRWDLAESDFERPDWHEAETLLTQVRQYYLQQPNPSAERLLWLDVSDAYRLQMLERFPETEQLLVSIQQRAGQALGDQHPITMTALQALATLRIKQNRPAEALPMIDTVLAWRRQHYGEGHYLTRKSAGRRGEALILLGRTREAESLLRQSWQTSVQVLGASHPHSLDLERLLAECLLAAGHPGEAERLFRDVLHLGRERMAANNNRLAYARYGLARLLRQQGRDVESTALLQEAANDFRHNFGEGHSMLSIIDHLLRQGQTLPAPLRTS